MVCAAVARASSCFLQIAILVVGLFTKEGYFQCFTDTSCTGDIVSAGNEKECCVETNDGLAFSDGGACTLCIVHGFANAFYDVVEEERLDTVFGLNVKGETNLPLMISGTITSEAGTASSSDFEVLRPIQFDSSVEIHLFTSNDMVTLEYNDTVILKFTPDSILLISGVESRGEFIRDSATVNIIDNDLLEINFEEAAYLTTEGSLLNILLQFRGTQSPFTLTLRSVSIDSAEISSVGGLSNCTSIGQDSKATPGADFYDETFTFKVDGESTEMGLFLIRLENVTIDDDIDESEQSFVLVAELGDDVPENFVCFQRQMSDTQCFGRTGSTEIRIMDNDVMMLGFDWRHQNVSENTGSDNETFPLSIGVSTMRTSERTHTIVFRYQQSSSSAIVETLTEQNDPEYDALFGTRQNNSHNSIEEILILAPGSDIILLLWTYIKSDNHPEDQECYTISIVSTDIKGVRELFTCNEDENNSTKFFCDHTICIDDDDEPLTIAFVETTYIVMESEGQVEVCINLTHISNSILDFTIVVESYNNESSIGVCSNPVLATPNSPSYLGKYTMTPGTDYEEWIKGINHIRHSVINATRRSICYNLTIYDDVRLEMSEYVGITLAVRDASVRTEVQPMYDQVIIEIVDNDMTVVGLGEMFYNVLEDVGMVEVCAIVYSPVVDCPVEFAFDVRLTTGDNSAVFPMDYVNVSTILAFGTCNTQQCIEISIVDDMIVEMTESFFVTLERISDLDSRIRLDPVEEKVEITDNDGAVVGLEKTSYTVSENVGAVEVCTIVHNSNLPCPIDHPFEVGLLTESDTAVTPLDYGNVSTILMFAACVTRSCVNITIENDARPESYEAFHVMLERTSGLNGRVTLKPVNGVITIMGDVGICYSQPNCVAGTEIDTPGNSPTPKDCCVGTNHGQSYSDIGGNCIVSKCIVHGFLNSFYDVIEGEALDTMFKLNVKGETSLPLFINGTITSERGTASSADFEDISIRVHEDIHFLLFITEDDITLEYEDTVILRFTPNYHALIPTVEQLGEFIRDTATVNILDNDRLEINFEEADYEFQEDLAYIPAIRLQFRITQSPFTLNIYPVSIIDFFNTDFDPSFDAEAFISSETNPGNIATAGDDFTSTQFLITIHATQYHVGHIFQVIQNDILNLIVTNDDVNELEQCFVLVAELGDDVPDSFACFQRSVGDTNCFGRTGATKINIVDNDEMIIGFSQRRQFISESYGASFDGMTIIKITVHSLGVSERDYEVLFRILETGNASIEANNVEFYAPIDALFGTRETVEHLIVIEEIRQLYIGSLNLTLNTTVLNDNVPEDVECYEIRIFRSQAFLCNEDNTFPEDFFCEHTICIEDDDEPFVVAYVQTTYTVIESKGQVEVCVNLTHPVIDMSEGNVHVAAFNDEHSAYIPPNSALATPNSPNVLGMYHMDPMTDYEEQIWDVNHISNTLINAMRRIVCFMQLIYDDLRLEVSEYAGLTLAVRDSSVHTIVQPMYDQLSIQIIDDDEAVVGLEKTFYNISESVGMIEVCAIVHSPMVECPIEFPFDVRLTATNGSAVSCVDYVNVSTILAFGKCDTRQCTEIPIVDDMIVEMNKSFFVTLERTSGLDSRIRLNPVEEEVEIINDDEAIVGLERTSNTVTEDAGLVEVCAIVYVPILPCPIEYDFEVRLSTEDDSAVASMDYKAVSAILMFAVCVTRGCMNISVQNDLQTEPHEKFNITLERPGLNGSITLDYVNGVIEIVDDDRFSQQCYSQPNCVAGSEIAILTDVPTPKDCCVGTNDGQSYGDSGGNCAIPQCVVHGFSNAIYNVLEGERLDTTFRLNVKGETSLPLVLMGIIALEKGTASSSDFENLQPIHIETNVDINIFTINDEITLEYDDTVILRFTPDNPLLISGAESDREYIRDMATVNIIDNDRLEINFQDADHSVVEGSPLSVLMQFRRTQSPFTVTFKAVSIASAETSSLWAKCATTGDLDSRATPGNDFTEITFNFTVEGDSTEMGVFLIRLENVTIDDDVDEIEQSFALVAELGPDVPDSFACFQRQMSDTECFGRTGAIEIRIMDNDPMIIGFDQRWQNVSENAGRDNETFPLFIDVSTMRTSERNHTIVFRYQQSSNIAIQSNPLYDALLGNGTDMEIPPHKSIEFTHILNPGSHVIPSLMAMVRNDNHPEDRECYTISIITRDVKGVREVFFCNEDESNPTDFFCDHTICIDDDDEPFMIGFMVTTYTVMESERQVEVCVNLIDSLVDIHNETVRVEVFNNPSSVYFPPNATLASPNSPTFLGVYPTDTEMDYEEQIRGINRIRNTVINSIATRRVVCYKQHIYDDIRLEMSEYIGLTLAVRDASVHTEVKPFYDEVAIQIVDDDTAMVSLELKLYNISEDVGVVEVCTVVNTMIDCPITFPFDVKLKTLDGSAVSPMDYDHISKIMAFDACDTRKCTEILIVDDTIVETTESFSLILERTSDLDSRIRLDPVDRDVKITDDDGGSSGVSGDTIAAIAPVVVVVTLIVLVVVLVAAILRRQLKNTQYTRNQTDGLTEYIMEEVTEGDNVDEDCQPTPVQQLKLELSHKNMIFSKKSLHLSKVVGQGESGLVYCGYLDSGGGRDMVAIKTCKALSHLSDKEKLLKEVTTMLSFTHPNVMSLIGVCFDEEVPLIIMPFMSTGSVLGYVKQNKDELYLNSQANQEEVATAEKLSVAMCHQISKGMQYLARHKFVHRDLAARNCMIDGHGVIKVADFGMSEDMYARNYFRHDKSEEGSEEKVPIRWMAPESIENGIYTERTDIWAFGVTCWEVFTCGRVPYTGVPAMALLSQLRSGHRLDRPRNATCSDEMWDMMMSCWVVHPQQRPGFTSLVKELFDMLDSDSTYLKLQ